MLAWIRPLLEPPVTPRGIAAKVELEGAMREIEALVAAWDGSGAPPDAMVAFLFSRVPPRRGGHLHPEHPEVYNIYVPALSLGLPISTCGSKAVKLADEGAPGDVEGNAHEIGRRRR